MAKKDNQKNKSGPSIKAKSTRSQRTRKQRLQKRMELLNIDHTGMQIKDMDAKLKELKKQGVKIPDLRKNNGAEIKTPNKEPKIIDIKEAHVMEEVEVIYKDKNTGTVRTTTKPRLIAMLDRLSMIAMSSKARNGEVVAATKEYLDRTIGKSKQEIKTPDLGLKKYVPWQEVERLNATVNLKHPVSKEDVEKQEKKLKDVV